MRMNKNDLRTFAVCSLSLFPCQFLCSSVWLTAHQLCLLISRNKEFEFHSRFIIAQKNSIVGLDSREKSKLNPFIIYSSISYVCVWYATIIFDQYYPHFTSVHFCLCVFYQNFIMRFYTPIRKIRFRNFSIGGCFSPFSLTGTDAGTVPKYYSRIKTQWKSDWNNLIVIFHFDYYQQYCEKKTTTKFSIAVWIFFSFLFYSSFSLRTPKLCIHLILIRSWMVLLY